jgi:hypothetical protein
MNEFKQDLIKQIKEKRPNLGANSIKTYISSLTSINKKMDGELTIEWYDKHSKEIILFLDKSNSNSKTSKTILSAIYILTSNKEIHDKMIELSDSVNKEYKTNKKTEKQVDNWISSDKIKDIYKDYYDKTIKIIKQRIINKYDTELVIKYLLLGFLSGSILAPRRSRDYALLKIRNYNKDVDNYYEKGVCYFNNYKTKNVYGRQTLLLPKELNDVIKKFNKINPTDYMLFSTNGNPLSSSQITKILNDIFGLNVSTSMLRHIFLSDKYSNVEEQMKQDAIAMGHSSNTQSEYIVK